MAERQSDRVAVRITPTEARMLDELCAWIGLNRTDTVRQLIRREHATQAHIRNSANTKARRK